jgi:ABC-type transport system involved in multi-copper enzyme maturation permease subunit
MIRTLYREELRATMRGHFAWLGAGVVLLALGGVAAAATQDSWVDGYGIIAYFLVPLAFIPLAAGVIASPRANRFVESLFTAPVERRDWFAAKILVLLTLAAAYYIALLPILAVYAHHVPLPMLLRKFLLWTPGILVASIAIGTLIGVLFIGRSIAAPAATGMGILLAYAAVVPLQELMVARGSGATRVGAITLLSPAVLLKNALGFTLVTGMIPATTTLTWISIALVVLGALVIAAWTFLRLQGVETWETTRRQSWALSIAIAALSAVPMLVADRNYDLPAPRPNTAPAIPAMFARGNGNFALTDPGEPMPGRCCGTILNRDATFPIGTDQDTKQDLLILLPVETDRAITGFSLRLDGHSGLTVVEDPATLVSKTPPFEQHAFDNDVGPLAPDGHHVKTGWIARVPVTLHPTSPWDIGGDRYPLTLTVTYTVAGETAPRMLTARTAVTAQVPTGMYEMAAAGAILPLLCFAAAIGRWRRTR